jgi:hypothetical protein
MDVVADSSTPRAVPKLWGPSSPTCAGCGTTENTHPDQRCGNISFCGDCSHRARNISDWDDLGVGD